MNENTRQLLLSDLQHFAESLWRNEELGEKRLNFFITLVTAVAGGLGALAVMESRSGLDVHLITLGALLSLLALGLMTWLRMVRRNLVSDQYIATLGVLRKKYATLAGIEGYEVPAKIKRELPRGGYAQTMATLEALLAAAFVAVWCGGTWLPVVTFTAVWVALLAAGWWARRPVGPVKQAGVIAYRIATGSPEFLLVTSRRTPTAWVFPKGHIKRGEHAAVAALRELREEAGVAGRLVKEVGTLAFKSGDEDVEVRYFLVEGTGDAHSSEGRKVAWLPPAEAEQRLSHPDARELFRAARALVVRD